MRGIFSFLLGLKALELSININSLLQNKQAKKSRDTH